MGLPSTEPKQRRSKHHARHNDALKSLFARVGVTRGMLRPVPSNESGATLQSLPPRQHNAVKRIYSKCVRELGELLFESDGSGFYEDFMERNSETAAVVSSLQHGILECKRGSVEKRVLMGVLCATFQGNHIAKLIQTCGDIANRRNSTENGNGNDVDEDYEDDGDDLINQAINNNSTENTTEQPPAKKQKLSGGFTRSFHRGRTDWNNLLITGGIPVHKLRRNRLRNGDNMIHTAIRYLFNPSHIQLFPRASRRIQLQHDWKRFPYFFQRLPSESLWRTYKEQCVSSTDGQFGRTIFIRLIQAFAKGQQHGRIHSSDDKFFNLVKENFKLMNRIIDKNINNTGVSEELKLRFVAVEEFLEFTYVNAHVGCNDNDPFHDLQFSLLDDNTSDEVRRSKCKECLSVFQVVKDLRMNLIAMTGELNEVLEDCSNKLLLFMSSQQRSFYQDQQVTSILKNVHESPPGSSAILFLNYRMKFDGSKCRNKFLSGNAEQIYWRSSMIFYKQFPTSEENEELLSNLFIDSLLVNDQGLDNTGDDSILMDSSCVASVLDGVLCRLRIEFPAMKNISIITDGNKKNDEYIHVISPFICKHHAFHLYSLIHPENEKGRTLFETHTAVTLKHLQKYYSDTKSSILNAGDLCTAWEYGHGVFNSSVELVSVGCSDGRSGHESKWIEALGNKRIRKMRRYCEFYYGDVINDAVIVQCHSYPGHKGEQFVFGRWYTNRMPGPDSGQNGYESSEDEVVLVADDELGDEGVDDDVMGEGRTGFDMIDTQGQGHGMMTTGVAGAVSVGTGEGGGGGHTLSSILHHSELEAYSNQFDRASLPSSSNQPLSPQSPQQHQPVNDTVNINTVVSKPRLYSGIETNVIVWRRSQMKMRSRRRRRQIRPESAVMDCTAELEVDLEEEISRDEDSESESESEIMTASLTNTSALPQCSKCMRVYQRESNMKRHEIACNGMNDQGTVINRAGSIACDLLEHHKLLQVQQNTTNEQKQQQELYYDPLKSNPIIERINIMNETIIEHGVVQGYSKRIHRNGNMGRNFIHRYEKEIIGYYNMWASGRDGRTASSLVKNALLARYPNNYDIPSEFHIKQAIQSLSGNTLDEDSSAGMVVNDVGGCGDVEEFRQGGGGYLGVPLVYAYVLRDMVLENRKFRPRYAKETLISRMNLDPDNLPVDFPQDKTIRNKISTLKTRLQ